MTLWLLTLTCIKDWKLGARREQHEDEDTELEEAFENLYLNEEEATGGGGADDVSSERLESLRD